MQNVIWVNKEKIRSKRKVSFPLTQTSYSYSKGFGIIEVLISAMIIIVVVGAAVGLGRAMVKRNVLVAEKAQAYNLVREGLEIGRTMRDTAWIDKEVNEWNDYLDDCTADKCKFVKDGERWQIQNGEELISVNNVNFIRVYAISNVELTDDDVNSGEAIKMIVDVSWGGADNNQHSITSSILLTNWKPEE